MRRAIIVAIACASLAFGMGSWALAGQGNPSSAGQPNQSCEASPNPPGNSSSAPGSAFNPDGQAGTVYAGEQSQNTDKGNGHSVSQYDVACTQNSSH